MRWSTISKTGGRENNEDYLGRMVAGGMACFALADGMGGSEGGEVASKLAVKTVLNCFKSHPGMAGELMYSYLEAAQNTIIDERGKNAKYRTMGTTIVVLITDGKRAIWAHCGDSRLYRLKKHLIQEVTDDHSVAFATFMSGLIKYSEIRISPDQNKLLRSLSDGRSFKPDISDVFTLPSKTSFLLCSDGFWEYVDEDFMEKSRRKSSSAHEWLMKMSAQRNRIAPENSDNYSAIAVYI